MAICANCGAELPPRFRFCGACGAPVPEAVAHDVRKVVTVLFCDVADSTGHGERLDPERMRNVLGRYFEEIEHVIVSHGGLVEKFVGDAVMAVFGLPAAHDDDALRAVRAAVEIRERLPALAEETGLSLAFRTGVNTGEVVAGNGQTLVTGDAVNVAARIQQAADPGDVVLGEATVRVLGPLADVEPLFPLPLRGKSEPVAAYRFIRLVAPAEKERGVFVGRERELALLQDTFRRASEERELHLVTLLGSAGIGKSRLAAEFLEALSDEARIARGRCLSYGEGITFWPLVEVLRALGEPAQTALGRVVSGGATSPQELAWTVQRALEQAAEGRPLVVLLEDLHWADDALLDLVDSICELSRSAPILILTVARPELLEQRPSWGGGKLNAASLLLEPLSSAESELLLDRLGEPLEPRQRRRVLELADGNPLFLEEASAFVAEGGGGGELPPRISALLQARLDLLAEPARRLLSTAAIEGTVFHKGSLERLVEKDIISELSVHLAALTRIWLIRPTSPELEGEEAFCFHHQLIRDVAYGALPKVERAALHEGFAEWVEERTDEREELAELVAFHLEQAALCQRELGEGVPALEARAASALAAAGERAHERCDMRAAIGLRRRALVLFDRDDPLVPALQLKLGIALWEHGEMEAARGLVEDAAEHAADPGVEANVRLVRQQLYPQGGVAAIRQQCEDAIALFEASGDSHGVGRALHTLGLAELAALQTEAAARAWEREAALARGAGWRAGEVWARVQRVRALANTRIPSSVAVHELERLAEEFPGEPEIDLDLRWYRSLAAYDAGLVAQARPLAHDAMDAIRRAGLRSLAAFSTTLVGWREAVGGDVDEGERLVLAGLRELRGYGRRASRALVLLADIRIAQGRYSEALELAHEAEQEGGIHERQTLIRANAARARAYARLGAVEEATAAGAEAVAAAEATDSLGDQADALSALAEALVIADDLPAALAAAERAARLWGVLARTLLAERAAALANEIEQRIARVGEPAPAA